MVVCGDAALAITQDVVGGEIEHRLTVNAHVDRPVRQIVVDERPALFQTERMEHVGQAVLSDDPVCGMAACGVDADLGPDLAVANVADANLLGQP